MRLCYSAILGLFFPVILYLCNPGLAGLRFSGVPGFCLYAFMDQQDSQGEVLIDKDQRDQLISIRSPPDRGLQYGLRIDLVEGCKIEIVLVLHVLGLIEHVSQAALAGGHDQPSPAAVAEPLAISLAFDICQAWQDLLPQEARVVLGAAVDLQEIADAMFSGGQDEETIRADVALHLLPLILVLDLIRIRPKLALRRPTL